MKHRLTALAAALAAILSTACTVHAVAAPSPTFASFTAWHKVTPHLDDALHEAYKPVGHRDGPRTSENFAACVFRRHPLVVVCPDGQRYTL